LDASAYRGNPQMKTGVGKFGLAAFAALIPFAISGASAAQVPDANAEAMVNCPDLRHPEPLTPYGFAKATLVSLWYAKNADRSAELTKATNDSKNYLAWMTAMMRTTKMSTNDFICAKRSVKPFAVKGSGENIETAAEFLVVVYNAHIGINQRLLDLFKKLDRTSQTEMSDQLSTLQVERGQRWSDLVQPTGLALMSLVDLTDPDHNGKTNRLIITKAQKKALLEWAGEHFPEFKNGTPQDRWSDPAKTAQLYLKFFNGHQGSDE
jgi:hypothetical protein